MNCNTPLAGDDDGPPCHLTQQGEAQWPDDYPGPEKPPKNPGRWAWVIGLGVLFVVVAGIAGAVLMRGGG